MRPILLLYLTLFFNFIYLVFSTNDFYNCRKRLNIVISINEIPLLLKHFMFCLEKCQQFNNMTCFYEITSQLKSSKLVLQELYYHGQLSYWVCINLYP